MVKKYDLLGAANALKRKLKGIKNAKPAETQLNVLERLYKQVFAQRVIQDAVENPRVGDPNAVSESEGKSSANGQQVTGKLNSDQKEKTPEKVKFNLEYDDAIDQLQEDKLDRSKNTHLKILDHTPQLYIDKAGAKDLKIIMGWDIAYLAMKKAEQFWAIITGLVQKS